MAQGDKLSGWAGFDSNDYMPYNDYAGIYIYNSNDQLIATPWYRDVQQVGDHVHQDWSQWDWTANTSGNYKVTFLVTNYMDTAYSSVAVYDAAEVTQAVPEPGSMALLGIGLFGILGRKLKKKK
jgi:hypothetical protein